MIIGIAGTLGAGKGTVVDYLVKNKGFKYFSISEFLAAEAVRQGKTPDRMARQAVANAYRAEGPTNLQKAVFEDAIKSGAENLIIEPQHTVAEVEFIKSKGGFVFGLDADLEVRYARITKRGGPKDQVTFEEFAAHNNQEMKSDDPNRNNLSAAIAATDFKIQNNGSIEELHEQIEKALNTI